MDEDINWQLEIAERFNQLCPNMFGDPYVSALAFGFQCHVGWKRILEGCFTELSKIPGVTVNTVKEKFGTLRIYIDGGDETAWDIISRYEQMSETVCELCGMPGRLEGKFWLMVRCEKCR